MIMLRQFVTNDHEFFPGATDDTSSIDSKHKRIFDGAFLPIVIFFLGWLFASQGRISDKSIERCRFDVESRSGIEIFTLLVRFDKGKIIE